jgi:hypothetical protein
VGKLIGWWWWRWNECVISVKITVLCFTAWWPYYSGDIKWCNKKFVSIQIMSSRFKVSWTRNTLIQQTSLTRLLFTDFKWSHVWVLWQITSSAHFMHGFSLKLLYGVTYYLKLVTWEEFIIKNVYNAIYDIMYFQWRYGLFRRDTALTIHQKLTWIKMCPSFITIHGVNKWVFKIALPQSW